MICENTGAHSAAIMCTFHSIQQAYLKAFSFFFHCKPLPSWSTRGGVQLQQRQWGDRRSGQMQPEHRSVFVPDGLRRPAVWRVWGGVLHQRHQWLSALLLWLFWRSTPQLRQVRVLFFHLHLTFVRIVFCWDSTGGCAAVDLKQIPGWTNKDLKRWYDSRTPILSKHWLTQWNSWIYFLSDFLSSCQ